MTKKHTNNLYKVTEYMLKELKIPVTKTAIKSAFNSEPNNNNLAFLSNTLEKWKIESLAIRVSEDHFSSISYPAIAHMSSIGEDNYFVLVKNVNDKSIKYFDSDNGVIKEELNVFLAKWSGILLLVEINSKSGELGYKTNRSREILQTGRLAFILLFLFCLLFACVTLSYSYKTFYLSALYFLGTILSSLLVGEEYGLSNPLLKKVCQINTKISCHGVLNSSAAKLFDWISMAELGLIYFGGNFCALLVSFYSGRTTLFLPFFLLQSTLALPYTFFSIYYQYKITRQWCILCLSVQLIFWLIFLIEITYVNNTDFINYSNFFCILLCLLMPAFFLAIVKPYITNYERLKYLKYELDLFRKDKLIFDTLLDHQLQIDMNYVDTDITMGKKNANLIITMVASPFCVPCANSYYILEDTFFRFQDNISIVLRFLVDLNGSNLDRVLFTKQIHMIARYQPEILANALHNWYETRNLSKWRQLFPISEYDKNLDSVIIQNQEWGRENGIEYTPTFFVNGKKLPNHYTIKDVSNNITSHTFL